LISIHDLSFMKEEGEKGLCMVEEKLLTKFSGERRDARRNSWYIDTTSFRTNFDQN
jgi:hypothetical protein